MSRSANSGYTWMAVSILAAAMLAASPMPDAKGDIIRPPAQAPAGSDAEGMAADPLRAQREDAARAERMAWWKEARFGMFLCWSPAAVEGPRCVSIVQPARCRPIVTGLDRGSPLDVG